MDDPAISAVVIELSSLLTGRHFGKIFQLGPSTLAIDFGLRDGHLFMSAEPAVSRLHLIKRKVRDLEKQSVMPSQFALSLKKELGHATVVSVEKDADERIVRIRLEAEDDLGEQRLRVMIVQLTGRAANLFLLNEEATIISQARAGRGLGQTVGEKYQPPPTQKGRIKSPTNRDARAGSSPVPQVETDKFNSISEALDAQYQSLSSEHAFETVAGEARSALRKNISRQRKLLEKLRADLATHANFEEQKRLGDLLLANPGAARRGGDRVTIIDYFADGAPEIEIEVDEKLTLPEEASRRFALYSRSKRAQKQISARLAQAESELSQLQTREKELERIIEARDEAALATVTSSAGPAVASSTPRSKREVKIAGTRRYVSSDGLEILVGRAARDNDNLTFKVARPNDLWLHTADYPGSHVVVRNPNRKEIPHRTIIEAAQIAAYFSQANKDPKVDVHYTPRKFLSKPKGAAPGLVRMSRFKNITVEPKESVARNSIE